MLFRKIEEKVIKKVLYLTPNELLNILIDLCDVPEEFKCSINDNIFYLRIDYTNEDKIDNFLQAKIQETLRKRFSLQERMTNNKNILGTHEQMPINH